MITPEELIQACKSNIWLELVEGDHSEDMLEARQEIVRKFENSFMKQCSDLTGTRIPIPGYRKNLDVDIIEDISYQLGALKEKRDHELAVAGASRSMVSANASAQASASIKATFNNTMSQIWALPDDCITNDQRQELAKMLQEIEDSTKDEGRLKKAVKTTFDWLCDNAIKAIPTVMPYITQAIKNVIGEA